MRIMLGVVFVVAALLPLVFGSGYLFADDVMHPVRGDEELPVRGGVDPQG